MHGIKKFISKWGIDGFRASIRRKKARSLQRKMGLPNGTHEKVRFDASKDDLERYLSARFRSAARDTLRSTFFTPKVAQPVPIDRVPAKVVAFYLPQFHPIPENNAWWGAGFTEWTNVSKAQPQFIGHYQPHIPGELGFYDLRLKETIQSQAQLAKHYGISAFCFHYYWFNGRRLLEKPLDLFLNSPEIDIEFCLCWANENWTRRWDGHEKDILMEQKYCAEDDIAFITALIKTFEDPRYIKIEGKPLLIIYRPKNIPNLGATVMRWRQAASEAGLPGLFLTAAESLDVIDVNEYGFDAAVEFPPHQANPEDITSKVKTINPAFQGHVYEYSALPNTFGKKNPAHYELFKTVMPSWDNEARKPGRGDSFANATPASYAQWLSNALDITLAKDNPDRRLIFINAWNEWGEGAHLEPDLANGYAYLHATASELARRITSRDLELAVEQHNSKFKKSSNIAVIYHSFYDELIGEVIEGRLAKIRSQVDFFVSLRKTQSIEEFERIKTAIPNSYFLITDNRGRDVLPFLNCLHHISENDYKIFCKIHSKRSPQIANGDQLRKSLISSLLPTNPEDIKDILSEFERDRQLALLAPPGTLLDLKNSHLNRGNTKWLDLILRELGAKHQAGRYKFRFPAGTMFWGRTASFSPLLNKDIFHEHRFEPELGQLDGTFAHAIERVIGFIASSRYTMKELEKNKKQPSSF